MVFVVSSVEIGGEGVASSAKRIKRKVFLTNSKKRVSGALKKSN